MQIENHVKGEECAILDLYRASWHKITPLLIKKNIFSICFFTKVIYGSLQSSWQISANSKPFDQNTLKKKKAVCLRAVI